jgi:ribosomal protein S6
MIEDVIKEDILEDEADLSAEALTEAETQIYEVGFHIVPTVEEGKLSDEVNSIKSLIEKNGGIFIAEEFPKNIHLAYIISKNIDGKIKKFNNAYFGWIKFEIKTDSIVNVKEALDLNKEILRYLIIKTVKESTLIPKDIISPKTEIRKNVKLLSVRKREKLEKFVKEDSSAQVNKKPVSEEELDKTIEELIVE